MMLEQNIVELSAEEIDLTSGGTVPVPIAGAFYWAGVVQTGQWVIEGAYALGRWVGEHS